MKTNQTFSLLILSTLTLLLSGCGPHLNGSDEADLEGTYSYAQYSEGSFTCPSNPNIIPSDSYGVDGTKYYGCANSVAPGKIKIKGQSADERNVCVYPIQFLNSTQFVYKMDGQSQPMYYCYDSWANPAAELEFSYTNYNAAVVVNYSKRAQMTACLVSGQNCPKHSIGRIR